MYSVLSSGGTITGYVVGDYYLTLDMARMFIDDLSGCKCVYGGRHGVFIISDVTGEAQQVYGVDSSNYGSFLSRCAEEAIKVHDIVFVPCKYTDFDWWLKNGMWTLDGCYCYKCMRGRELLGYILLTSNLYTSRSVKIAMFEVVEKRRGHGTLIVNELKSRGIKLSGVSTLDAKSFWEEQGAVMSEFNKFKI